MEFHKKDAIYLQIVEMICGHILTRSWAQGEKIPSVRELAIAIEVNPNTVLRAYGLLQEKGIIQIRRGVGYYVAENAYSDTLAFMKSRFIENDLPLFFKAVKLLGITFDELKERYAGFGEGCDTNENQQ